MYSLAVGRGRTDTHNYMIAINHDINKVGGLAHDYPNYITFQKKFSNQETSYINVNTVSSEKE